MSGGDGEAKQSESGAARRPRLRPRLRRYQLVSKVQRQQAVKSALAPAARPVELLHVRRSIVDEGWMLDIPLTDTPCETPVRASSLAADSTRAFLLAVPVSNSASFQIPPSAFLLPFIGIALPPEALSPVATGRASRKLSRLLCVIASGARAAGFFPVGAGGRDRLAVSDVGSADPISRFSLSTANLPLPFCLTDLAMDLV